MIARYCCTKENATVPKILTTLTNMAQKHRHPHTEAPTNECARLVASPSGHPALGARTSSWQWTSFEKGNSNKRHSAVKFSWLRKPTHRFSSFQLGTRAHLWAKVFWGVRTQSKWTDYNRAKTCNRVRASKRGLAHKELCDLCPYEICFSKAKKKKHEQLLARKLRRLRQAF